ncbi:unnamed protein product [Toxocara canis]|uniref:Myosin motor domain-containing protein n=1 Tax=Toxocara canis TaxID=6265 RepID=A0A183V3M6_TOXCA|nr:unnamed protein product [Toxocara canis]
MFKLPCSTLIVQEQAARDFDNSSHRWIADPIEGFIATAITVIEDDQLTLRMPDNTLKKLNVKETQEISLAKLEKAEQMAHLSFINEASVLHNLRQRYRSMLTYTYSGSFCVFINPNKLLPIYTDSVATIYIGHHRTQMPPHIFASVDESYRNLIYDGRPQSILLTGESGSGKTENAKAVMFYLSKIARGASETVRSLIRVLLASNLPYEIIDIRNVMHHAFMKETSQRLTEQRILKANLLIEAFGNAATKRNCNSSRFSKFLRIFFNKGGTMIGAHISHCKCFSWHK